MFSTNDKWWKNYAARLVYNIQKLNLILFDRRCSDKFSSFNKNILMQCDIYLHFKNFRISMLISYAVCYFHHCMWFAYFSTQKKKKNLPLCQHLHFAIAVLNLKKCKLSWNLINFNRQSLYHQQFSQFNPQIFLHFLP